MPHTTKNANMGSVVRHARKSHAEKMITKTIEFERLAGRTVSERWRVDTVDEEVYYVSKQESGGYCRGVLQTCSHGDIHDLRFCAWVKNNKKLIAEALRAYRSES